MRKKNYSWLFFFFLSLSIVQGQACLCSPQDAAEDPYQWYTVAAPSGLVLREGASRNTAKLDAIPFGEEVFACRETGIDEIIEGKSGYWIKVTWANKIGYLFSGFLTKTNDRKVRMIIPNTGFNSEWECLELAPEVKWQGLMDTATTTTHLREDEHPAFFSSTALKTGRKKVHPDCNEQGYLNNAVLNVSKSPFAVFSGFLLADKVVNLTPIPVKLTPGTAHSLFLLDRTGKTQRNYLITVEGNVFPNPQFSKGYGWSPFDRIEHYKINLYEQTDYPTNAAPLNKWSTQKLTDCTVKIPNDCDTYDMDVQYIYFAGDLDGDNQLDLILSQRGLGSAYHLYLSSQKISGFLLRYVADWADVGD